jgi:hypothetical protein
MARGQQEQKERQMTRLIGSLAVMGLAAAPASAHPGHGLEGLDHLLSHAFGGALLLALAGATIYAVWKNQGR